jgi:hypothetical protein
MVLWSLVGAPAFACGQSAHVWVTTHALEHLPPGPLADLLTREDLRDALINGAMFPDGGYSPLTQDGYGEAAHWPPLHTAYLDWIGEQDGDVDAHLAMLFGMSAHGYADHIFDGIFLQRSRVYDAASWAEGDDVDVVSDVAMVAEVGPQPVPEDVVPYDALAEVFARTGREVAPTVMQTGQASLRLAVTFVGGTGSDPEQAAPYLERFTWTNGHLTDPTVPGSPACIGEVLADHWATLWARHTGTWDPDGDDWVVATWPRAGTGHHATDSLDIESVVSLAFARALDLDTLDGAVEVTAADGTVLPVDARLYYRDRSNVLNLWPLEDLAEDTAYTVTVKRRLRAFDGEQRAEPWSFTFYTGEPPAPPVEAAETGCGCRTGTSPWWAWLLLTAVARRGSPPSGRGSCGGRARSR